MAGVHASTTRNFASARKSAVWLLQIAGAASAILIQLALMAYMVNLLVTQLSDAWPPSIGLPKTSG